MACHFTRCSWTVRLKINGKQLCGGTLKPKDSTPEEVERARLAAVESRRKLEEKYFTIKRSAAISFRKLDGVLVHLGSMSSF